MRPLLPALVLLLVAGAAEAACYADYKASRRDPFALQYGVAEVFGPCDAAAAQAELAPRLQDAGWQLLEVVSTFDEGGLEARRESAGEHFLRY